MELSAADASLNARANVVLRLSTALVVLSLLAFLIAIFSESAAGVVGVSWLTSLVAPIFGQCGLRYRSRWMIAAFGLVNLITAILFVAIVATLTPSLLKTPTSRVSFVVSCLLFITELASIPAAVLLFNHPLFPAPQLPPPVLAVLYPPTERYAVYEPATYPQPSPPLYAHSYMGTTAMRSSTDGHRDAVTTGAVTAARHGPQPPEEK